jgi:hypothetical protein
MATSESIGRGAQSTVEIADVIVELLNQEFEELVREHYQMAYHTAFAVLGSAEDAEDVAQTIFLRLLHQRTTSEAKSYGRYDSPMREPGQPLPEGVVPGGDTVFNALQKQLELTLVRARGPRIYYTVESITRPTPN